MSSWGKWWYVGMFGLLETLDNMIIYITSIAPAVSHPSPEAHGVRGRSRWKRVDNRIYGSISNGPVSVPTGRIVGAISPSRQPRFHCQSPGGAQGFSWKAHSWHPVLHGTPPHTHAHPSLWPHTLPLFFSLPVPDGASWLGGVLLGSHLSHLFPGSCWSWDKESSLATMVIGLF